MLQFAETSSHFHSQCPLPACKGCGDFENVQSPFFGTSSKFHPPPVVNCPELAAVARAIHPTRSDEESKESKERKRYNKTAEPSKLPGEGAARCKSTRISSNYVYDDIIDFDLGDEGAGIQGNTADGNGLRMPVNDIEGGFDDFPPEAEVSKYTFFQQLTHYLEGAKITQQNPKAVEIVILVESGTCVRNMDAMKKAKCKEVLLRKYVSRINEINNDCFEEDLVRIDMLNRYKGATKQLSGENLLRKLDLEMRDVRK
jgi:hypothetical protein